MTSWSIARHARKSRADLTRTTFSIEHRCTRKKSPASSPQIPAARLIQISILPAAVSPGGGATLRYFHLSPTAGIYNIGAERFAGACEWLILTML